MTILSTWTALASRHTSVLRPGPHGQHGRVLRRRRTVPGLQRPLLLPALARVRHWMRLLPPRPRQEPGAALGVVPASLAAPRTASAGMVGAGQVGAVSLCA